MSDISEINAVSLLEDFKSGNNENKISAIKSIYTIILCLGKTRTIKEFIPFLIEFCEEEDDIIIIELNSQLKTILEFVGPGYFDNVFELWMKIALMEESSIIKSSIKAFTSIFELYNHSKFEAYLTKNLEFLFENKNYSLLLNIILIIYTKIQSTRERLFNTLKEITLLEDYNSNQELLVLLSDYSKLLSLSQFNIILSNLTKSSQYDINIKITIIKPLSEIMLYYKNKKEDSNELNKLKDTVISIIKIDEIRLKIALIQNAYNLILFNNEEITNIIYEYINSLIISNNQDQEQKQVISENIPQVFKGLYANNNTQIIDSLLKSLQILSKEQSPSLRKYFASNILKVSPYIQKKVVFDTLFPIFLELIKDESLEVRIELLISIKEVNSYISIEDAFDSVYPQILEIAQCKSWRIRYQLRLLSDIFISVLSEKLLLEKIFPIYLNWLSDPVYTIRREGAVIVNKFLHEYPSLFDKVNEKINELKSNKSYLLKVTLAYFLQCMVLDSKNKLVVEKKLINVVLELAKSSISNVAINCETTVKELIHIKEVKDESQFILGIISKYKKE